MKRKKKALIIIPCTLFFLAASFFLLIFKLASLVVTGKRQSLEEALKWQSDKYDTSFYDSLTKVDYEVMGDGDYVIHTQLLKNPEETDKYMIISHGYTDNRIGSLKYARMYLDLGFNCIIYDLRGHGENDEHITTYGIIESKDLIKLIEDTRDRYKDIKMLGIHGESLGAATTITALKYKPDVDFAVADCGFSDLENVLREGYRNGNIPNIGVDLANLGLKLRYHYSLDEMRPIDALDDNEIPILFIHGSADTFIYPKNSEDMQKRTKGYSEFHMIDGAEHAMSVITDPDTYKEYVRDFLYNVFKD